MSAVTTMSGTPSIGLMRRLLFAMRIVPAGRLRLTMLQPTAKPGPGAVPDATRVRSPLANHDPLDDLMNATWEDAEWQ